MAAVAAALNILLYFGVFLPRVTPLIGHAYAIVGTSLPGAISGLGSEARVHPDASSKTHSEVSKTHSEVSFGPEARGKSHPEARSYLEAGGTSRSEAASGEFRSETSGKPAPEASLEPGTDPPPGSPSGSPPVSPPSQSFALPQSSASPASPQSPPGSPPSEPSTPLQQQYP